MDWTRNVMDKSRTLKPSPIYREDNFRVPFAMDRQVGLWVDRIGEKKQTSDWLRGLRILGQYLVAGVLEGEGTLITAPNHRHPLRCGDVFFLRPNQAAFYGPPDGSVWSYCWVVFNGPRATLLEEFGFIDAQRLVVSGKAAAIVSAHQKLSTLKPDPSIERALDRHNIICEMLSQLPRRSNRNETSEDDRVLRAAARLEIGVNRNVSLEKLAREVGLSVSQMRRIFQKHYGMSPKEYSRQSHMLKAQSLFMQTNRTVKDVAAELGYDDVYYFMRTFKLVTGKTTSHFRSR
jgi:AraC-like DNA-binding protein